MGQNCLTRFVLDMLQPCSFKNEVEGEPPPMLSRDCFFLTTCLDQPSGSSKDQDRPVLEDDKPGIDRCRPAAAVPAVAGARCTFGEAVLVFHDGFRGNALRLGPCSEACRASCWRAGPAPRHPRCEVHLSTSLLDHAPVPSPLRPSILTVCRCSTADFDHTLTAFHTAQGDQQCLECHDMVQACPTMSDAFRDDISKVLIS